MKYLGVDYGEKKIGLAISDSAGRVAMPFKVLDNNEKLLGKFLEILDKEKINGIVFGLSLNLESEENMINRKMHKFAEKIREITKNSIIISFQDERFSSREAKWGLDKIFRRPKKRSRKKISENRIDDKAATMILRSFLEAKNNGRI